MSLHKRTKIQVLREAIVKVTRILSESTVDVILVGNRAKVEYDHSGKPTVIYLPALPDNASDKLIESIQGFVDHEVGHVLFTDFDVLLDAKKMGIAQGFNAAEDTYIERKMIQLYGGTHYNIHKMREMFLELYIEPRFKKFQADGVTDPMQWWGLLCVCSMRAWAGHTEFVNYMADKWHLIQDVVDRVVKAGVDKQFASIKNSRGSLGVAVRLSNAIYGEPPEEEEPEEPEEEPEEEEPEEPEEEPEEDEDAEEDESEEPDDSDESESDEQSEDGESDDSSPGDIDEESEDGEAAEEPGDESPEDDLDTESEPEEPEEPSDESEGDNELAVPKGHDESAFSSMEDALNQEMEQEFDEIDGSREYRPFSRDGDYVGPPEDIEIETRHIDRMEKDIRSSIGPCQRALSNAFRAQNRDFKLQGRRDGKLSSRNLHRLAAGDTRVFYKDKNIRTQKVAVALVIDQSGSMQGSKISLAAQVGWALSEVLTNLKIPHEVSGFTMMEFDESDQSHQRILKAAKEQAGGIWGLSRYSRTRPLYLPIFKAWDESVFTLDHKRRFTTLGMGRYNMHANVDGESLIYAAERLMRRREPGKAMIVLSDGMPSGDGCGDRVGESEHLKDVTKELEAVGINLVGIGINTDVVKQYYRKHVVINNLEELPDAAIGQVRDALLNN